MSSSSPSQSRRNPLKSRSHQRSQFGSQTESLKRSSPSCGFGTSPRFGTERQFLSKDHSKQLNCPTWTPGPGQYIAASSVGRQASSESKSHAAFGFGTSSRFNHEKLLAKKSRTLPAPGAYKATTALGRQVISTKGSANGVPFGSSSRAHVVVEKGFEQAFFGMESPGPAMYRNSKGFFAKNNEELSLLGPSFGKDPRAIDPKKPNDLERRSAAVPGPGMYPTGSSMGHQVNSYYPSKPQFVWPSLRGSTPSKDGDDAKSTSLKGKTPPTSLLAGSKKETSLGGQIISERRTASAFSFGSQSRFPMSQDTSFQAPGPGSYII